MRPWPTRVHPETDLAAAVDCHHVNGDHAATIISRSVNSPLGVAEYPSGFAQSIRLDAREFDHLRPLIGVASDDLAELPG
jgi:hypothetical protein